MGSKYAIYSYKRTYRPQDVGKRGYIYDPVWRGDSLVKAVLVMIGERRKGIRCIKLEYRP